MFKEIMGSKTRQIIFKAFFDNPDEEFYTRQLASLHKVSAGTLHRELKKLVSIEMLSSRNVGNIKLFSLNKKSPIYEELKNIYYKTEGVIKYVRDVVLKIKGIKTAFIYGSFAKGDERKDSDIDLFLIGDDIDDDTLISAISDLERELFKEINYTSYTENRIQKRKKQKGFLCCRGRKRQKDIYEGVRE
jgi:predicted nucleotidyltransferase